MSFAARRSRPPLDDALSDMAGDRWVNYFSSPYRLAAMSTAPAPWPRALYYRAAHANSAFATLTAGTRPHALCSRRSAAPVNRLDAALLEEGADCIGIVAFVGEELFDTRDQADAFFRHHAIGGIARREDERPGAAEFVDHRMDLAVAAAFRRPDRLKIRPPFPPANFSTRANSSSADSYCFDFPSAVTGKYRRAPWQGTGFNRIGGRRRFGQIPIPQSD
jgi:hypothetical protein